jgi:hypothetical protein
MKARKLIIGFFSLSLLVFSGCVATGNDLDDAANYQTDKVLYSHNAKLKQILYCESLESGEILGIDSEYEYDEAGRISKVSRPMYDNGNIVGLFSYDLYSYNGENQLEKITNYHSNINFGFINLITTTFIYDGSGNKVKAQIEYPQINETDYILYFYDAQRLIREEKYHRNTKEEYIEYEYNTNGQIVKETSYANDDTPFTITKHTYQDGVNSKSEIFLPENNEKIREIKRLYDKNNNLIFVESHELSPYSSRIAHSVLKHEYYE